MRFVDGVAQYMDSLPLQLYARFWGCYTMVFALLAQPDFENLTLFSGLWPFGILFANDVMVSKEKKLLTANRLVSSYIYTATFFTVFITYIGVLPLVAFIAIVCTLLGYLLLRVTERVAQKQLPNGLMTPVRDCASTAFTITTR